jgi:hypothetical protein
MDLFYLIFNLILNIIIHDSFSIIYSIDLFYLYSLLILIEILNYLSHSVTSISIHESILSLSHYDYSVVSMMR